jgi:hypothetical protein
MQSPQASLWRMTQVSHEIMRTGSALVADCSGREVNSMSLL